MHHAERDEYTQLTFSVLITLRVMWNLINLTRFESPQSLIVPGEIHHAERDEYTMIIFSLANSVDIVGRPVRALALSRAAAPRYRASPRVRRFASRTDCAQ